MIKIAICDDENKTLLANEKRVKEYLSKNKVVAEVKCYNSSEFLLFDIMENNYYDLLLVDIEMPGKSGMDIAKAVKEISPEALLVFITSYNEYAMESFELSVFRYIQKDKVDEKLFGALEDALINIEKQKDKMYHILTPTRYEKMPYKSILYIQKDGKYSIITTNRGETQIRKSLLKVHEELDSVDFVLIDRSCVVNLYHVMKIDDFDVIMRNGIALPISKKRMKDLKSLIHGYWGGTL